MDNGVVTSPPRLDNWSGEGGGLPTEQEDTTDELPVGEVEVLGVGVDSFSDIVRKSFLYLKPTSL